MMNNHNDEEDGQMAAAAPANETQLSRPHEPSSGEGNEEHSDRVEQSGVMSAAESRAGVDFENNTSIRDSPSDDVILSEQNGESRATSQAQSPSRTPVLSESGHSPEVVDSSQVAWHVLDDSPRMGTENQYCEEGAGSLGASASNRSFGDVPLPREHSTTDDIEEADGVSLGPSSPGEPEELPFPREDLSAEGEDDGSRLEEESRYDEEDAVSLESGTSSPRYSALASLRLPDLVMGNTEGTRDIAQCRYNGEDAGSLRSSTSSRRDRAAVNARAIWGATSPIHNVMGSMEEVATFHDDTGTSERTNTGGTGGGSASIENTAMSAGSADTETNESRENIEGITPSAIQAVPADLVPNQVQAPSSTGNSGVDQNSMFRFDPFVSSNLFSSQQGTNTPAPSILGLTNPQNLWSTTNAGFNWTTRSFDFNFNTPRAPTREQSQAQFDAPHAQTFVENNVRMAQGIAGINQDANKSVPSSEHNASQPQSVTEEQDSSDERAGNLLARLLGYNVQEEVVHFKPLRDSPEATPPPQYHGTTSIRGRPRGQGRLRNFGATKKRRPGPTHPAQHSFNTDEDKDAFRAARRSRRRGGYDSDEGRENEEEEPQSVMIPTPVPYAQPMQWSSSGLFGQSQPQTGPQSFTGAGGFGQNSQSTQEAGDSSANVGGAPTDEGEVTEGPTDVITFDSQEREQVSQSTEAGPSGAHPTTVEPTPSCARRNAPFSFRPPPQAQQGTAPSPAENRLVETESSTASARTTTIFPFVFGPRPQTFRNATTGPPADHLASSTASTITTTPFNFTSSFQLPTQPQTQSPQNAEAEAQAGSTTHPDPVIVVGESELPSTRAQADPSTNHPGPMAEESGSPSTQGQASQDFHTEAESTTNRPNPVTEHSRTFPTRPGAPFSLLPQPLRQASRNAEAGPSTIHSHPVAGDSDPSPQGQAEQNMEAGADQSTNHPDTVVVETTLPPATDEPTPPSNSETALLHRRKKAPFSLRPPPPPPPPAPSTPSLAPEMEDLADRLDAEMMEEAEGEGGGQKESEGKEHREGSPNEGEVEADDEGEGDDGSEVENKDLYGTYTENPSGAGEPEAGPSRSGNREPTPDLEYTDMESDVGDVTLEGGRREESSDIEYTDGEEEAGDLHELYAQEPNEPAVRSHAERFGTTEEREAWIDELFGPEQPEAEAKERQESFVEQSEELADQPEGRIEANPDVREVSSSIQPPPSEDNNNTIRAVRHVLRHGDLYAPREFESRRMQGRRRKALSKKKDKKGKGRENKKASGSRNRAQGLDPAAQRNAGGSSSRTNAGSSGPRGQDPEPAAQANAGNSSAQGSGAAENDVDEHLNAQLHDDFMQSVVRRVLSWTPGERDWEPTCSEDEEREEDSEGEEQGEPSVPPETERSEEPQGRGEGNSSEPEAPEETPEQAPQPQPNEEDHYEPSANGPEDAYDPWGEQNGYEEPAPEQNKEKETEDYYDYVPGSFSPWSEEYADNSESSLKEDSDEVVEEIYDEEVEDGERVSYQYFDEEGEPHAYRVVIHGRWSEAWTSDVGRGAFLNSLRVGEDLLVEVKRSVWLDERREMMRGNSLGKPAFSLW